MDSNLDQYITSGISKQFHGLLAVVLDPKQAVASSKASSAPRTPPKPLSGWSTPEEKIAAHLVKDLKKAMHPK